MKWLVGLHTDLETKRTRKLLGLRARELTGQRRAKHKPGKFLSIFCQRLGLRLLNPACNSVPIGQWTMDKRQGSQRLLRFASLWEINRLGM